MQHIYKEDVYSKLDLEEQDLIRYCQDVVPVLDFPQQVVFPIQNQSWLKDTKERFANYYSQAKS